ncbi:MAG: DUF1385 domain-containing protein [Eubacteriales bacterium]
MSKEKKEFKTLCGGQALIEGIMMRGPKKQAIVVRKPDGTLSVQEKELKLIKDKFPLLGLPFLRGAVTFLDAQFSGIAALMYSAEFMPEEEEIQPSKWEIWLEQKLGSQGLTKLVTYFAVFLSFCLSMGLFFVLPTFLGSITLQFTESQLVRNIAESTIKVIIFIAYLAFCSKMPDIRRTFQYHGAEHKTIFCYEKGLPLTLENVKEQPCHHPRCGTSFLFFVIFISILISAVVYHFYPVHQLLFRLGANICMLPFVVGISYECNRFLGRHDKNPFCRFFMTPGLWLQNFTTYEPEDGMIEVGIHALKLVLPEKEGEDSW